LDLVTSVQAGRRDPNYQALQLVPAKYLQEPLRFLDKMNQFVIIKMKGLKELKFRTI
jgi:hypothetical protein